MDKGQYGYIKKYKRNIILSMVILGAAILVGVIISLVLYGTTSSLIIIIPILVCIPFAKQVVAFIMCAGFKPLAEDEHQHIADAVTYSDTDDLLFDISLSRYEGMLYFPAAVVRDGRMLFLYKGKFGKKISDAEGLKKAITDSFSKFKKPYIVMVSTDDEDFIKKANSIKAPDADYIEKDKNMREKLFELGV